MKTLVAIMIALCSTAALADGFVCQTQEGDLRIHLYNNVQPALGTRTGAVMVVSAPEVGQGNKTIARFSDANLTLSNQGASYTGKVDLRFNDSGRGGEFISGTRLAQLAAIRVNIAFSYNQPVVHGTMLPGYLLLAKRNGDRIQRKVVCARYLKGE